MAKKPTITSVTSGYQATTTINNNFSELRNAFDNTLSLDGSTPNAMEADLDLNSNDILNANVINTTEIVVGGINLTDQVTLAEDAADAAIAAAALAAASETASGNSATSAATSASAASLSASEAAQSAIDAEDARDASINFAENVTFTATTVSAGGESTASYDPETLTVTLGLVVGNDGADGVDGVDGTNGTDGVDGTDGLGWTGGSYNAGTGVVTFTSDDGLGFSTGDLRGADGIDGTNGTNGTNGTDGADGVGVPAGGTTGQVLAKASGDDYDTEWVDQTGGGGSGDMTKAVYDTDNDGIVDAAESVPWSGVTSTPTTLSGYGITDTYTETEVDTLLSGKANTTHTHAISDVTGLQTALDNKLDDSQASAFGLTLLDDADAATARTTLGLGTLATQDGTFSGTSSGTNTGDQNLFSTIAVSGQDNVVADSTGDTLTLVAGTNVTITTDASTDTVTIAASGGGSSTGALLRAPQILTSGTSYTSPSGCNSIYVEAVGGGGGAGGYSTTADNIDAGTGGGGAGAYVAKYFSVSPSTSYTYAIGAGGTAGNSNGGNGGTGGSTTFTVGATTITAAGGTGSSGNGGGSNSGGTAGGDGGAASNGDINITGNDGGPGFNNASSGGMGGASYFGGAGKGGYRSNNGATAGGVGTTGSGAGGIAVQTGTATASSAGSAGGAGLIRIWEYS